MKTDAFVPPLPKGLRSAEADLWALDRTGGADRRWRHRVMAHLPDDFAKSAVDHYRKLWLAGQSTAANTGLRELAESVDTCHARLARDNDALILYARRRAHEASLIRARFPDTDLALTALQKFANNHAIPSPGSPKPFTAKQAIARLCDEVWWRRTLRKIVGRSIERAAIKNNMVNSRHALYVSDDTLRRRRMQRQRNRELIALMVAENETGQAVPLQDLVEHSLSNPHKRRAELMTRIAGCENYSIQHGHDALLVTLTCPSRFHASISHSGARNPKYSNTSPRDSQSFLRRQWSRVRTSLKRKTLHVYGVRIAEPHHDGTVHWHILVFGPATDLSMFEELCRHHWLSEDPDEPGARERRVSVVKIDRNMGTAAGYVAKYISKNVDGEHVGVDFEDAKGRTATNTAERVEAWASTWGIRQFQFFGQPLVTIWRELRRIRQPVLGPIEPFRAAADEGNWALYMQLMEASDSCVELIKAWNDRPDRYGDARGWEITGVRLRDTTVSTRNHIWILKRVYLAKQTPYTEAIPYTDATSTSSNTPYTEETPYTGPILGIHTAIKLPSAARAATSACAKNTDFCSVLDFASLESCH